MIAFLAPIAAAIGDDIRDIRGPILPPPSHPWWPYVAAGIAVLAIAMIVRTVIRRRRRAIPADVQALRALEAARELIDRHDPDQFSTRVSAAVRGYVEAAFQIHAPRLTTDELLADLMTEASPVAAHRAELGTFLSCCDLAKYARWSLSRPEMTSMLDSAAAFVRATASPKAAQGGSP